MIPYLSSGCTGEPPLPGKHWADAFTSTSHEKHLNKTKKTSPQQVQICTATLIYASINNLLQLFADEPTTSINFVTKDFHPQVFQNRIDVTTPRVEYFSGQALRPFLFPHLTTI